MVGDLRTAAEREYQAKFPGTCDHAVGLWVSGYLDGGASLLDYSEVLRHPSSQDRNTRFCFCSKCGAKIDYAPIDSALRAEGRL